MVLRGEVKIVALCIARKGIHDLGPGESYIRNGTMILVEIIPSRTRNQILDRKQNLYLRAFISEKATIFHKL